VDYRPIRKLSGCGVLRPLMKDDTNARRTVPADSPIFRNADRPEDLQAEIAYLTKKLSDLQKLVGELLMKNERMRQSLHPQSD
jgi:hypothetical protein